MNRGYSKVRLQRILADRGYSSRRNAEKLIADGQVTVNGSIAELGQKADPLVDCVKVKGKLLPLGELESITMLLNKPRGLICSHRDPYHSNTVFDLIPSKYSRHHLFCAGRLDKESEGLLIITSDGGFAERLMHPRNEIRKRYRITLNKPFDTSRIPLLIRGVTVKGEHLKAERVLPLKRGSTRTTGLELHLQHGRNREIRRMLEVLGYRVERLQRFQIGKLVLRGTGPGKFRILGEKDVRLLFS